MSTLRSSSMQARDSAAHDEPKDQVAFHFGAGFRDSSSRLTFTNCGRSALSSRPPLGG